MGADSICIKDMAGLLSPYNAEKLVRTLKSQLTVPIDIHTHFTSGMGDMTYLKAIEAGVDMIDTALSPFAQSTGQLLPRLSSLPCRASHVIPVSN